ncbi:fork head domain-containing protein [Mycena vulgaris]|nr:fork head domain-containing protein [Mycena vulgaris]KAJ6601750.1 fork head domain-containing protein [Mycena vulgaris]
MGSSSLRPELPLISPPAVLSHHGTLCWQEETEKHIYCQWGRGCVGQGYERGRRGDAKRAVFAIMARPPLISLAVDAQKASIPLPALIKLAIYGSENKRLPREEIYTELTLRFKWFREHRQEQAWKNSIRHNLSLNKVFRRIEQPATEAGKGSYWELDVSRAEGYKLPRKMSKSAEHGLQPKDQRLANWANINDALSPSQRQAVPGSAGEWPRWVGYGLWPVWGDDREGEGSLEARAKWARCDSLSRPDSRERRRRQ